MSLNPVVNCTVAVPFNRQFPDALKADSMLVFCGRIPEDSTFFVINLQDGKDPKNIPFHFGARFEGGQDKIVYSNQQGADWAAMSEVCCDFGKRGSEFKLAFFIWNNCYQVCVNGKHSLIYDRAADMKIDTINIYGQVQINSVKVYDLRCA
ncbi:galectin-8-like [Leucoraja erinacea]|uniref:galectin-8-like n=1 Tax=Leucoraja erinaceus TaxID=7782 RepID=UPI002454F7AD|nr:galectin-8-like [Leucoraja erinacea]